MVNLFGKLHNGENYYPIFDSETNKIIFNRKHPMAGYNQVHVGITIDIYTNNSTPVFIGNINGYYIYSGVNALEEIEDTVECFCDVENLKIINYKQIASILKEIYDGVFVITDGTYDWDKNKSYDNCIVNKIIPDLLENSFYERINNIILNDKII